MEEDRKLVFQGSIPGPFLKIKIHKLDLRIVNIISKIADDTDWRGGCIIGTEENTSILKKTIAFRSWNLIEKMYFNGNYV